MTGGNDDVWGSRRRLGETLRRWATPARTDAQAPSTESSASEPPTSLPTSSAARSSLLPASDRPAASQLPEMSAPPARLWRLLTALCPWPHRARRDRGAATIFVMAIGLVLVLMGVAGAAVGAARVGRHRAQAAADLGALAGAARVIEGAGAACERAARFVAVNGGRATACEVSGLEIVLRTEVVVAPLPGLTRHATAAARAGPVYAPGF